MSFELTQQEINRLHFCKEQMVFVSDLCYMTEGHHSITIEGLGSFLTAQIEILNATITAANERETAQLRLSREAAKAAAEKPPALPISAALLMRVMEACSGATQDEKALLALNNDLYDATLMHGEAEPVWAYHSALRRQGFSVNFFDGNGALQTNIMRAASKKAPQSAKALRVAARKRDKLVAA